MSGYYKNEVYALLNDKGIPYEAVEHEAVFTMEEMERAGIDAHGCICKNLFLRDAKGRQHYLVTVPDERRVDLKWLSAALSSSKLSFASAERLDTYLKLPQGSVSPLGILNDESRSVIFAADAALASLPAIGVHPNDNTATVFLSFADLRQIIEAHGNSVALIFRPAPGMHSAGSGAFCPMGFQRFLQAFLCLVKEFDVYLLLKIRPTRCRISP